jgi:hypothetical protein
MAVWKKRQVAFGLRGSIPTLWGAFFGVGLVASVPAARGQSWALDPHCRMEKAVMAVYRHDSTEVAAFVRANRIYWDYQRRGFFRIGVLPAVVMQGLNIEVRDPAQIAQVLTNAATLFRVKPGVKNAVEAKGFSLSFESKSRGHLQAKWATLAAGNEWLLEDGTVQCPATGVAGFDRALLTVAGPGAGTLSCQTTNGPLTLNLVPAAEERETQK